MHKSRPPPALVAPPPVLFRGICYDLLMNGVRRTPLPKRVEKTKNTRRFALVAWFGSPLSLRSDGKEQESRVRSGAVVHSTPYRSGWRMVLFAADSDPRLRRRVRNGRRSNPGRSGRPTACRCGFKTFEVFHCRFGSFHKGFLA